MYGAIDFAEAVGIDSEDSFDITKYILDEKKEEIPFAEFGKMVNITCVPIQMRKLNFIYLL